MTVRFIVKRKNGFHQPILDSEEWRAYHQVESVVHIYAYIQSDENATI